MNGIATMKECSQVEESRKFTIMGGDGSTYGTITGGEVLKWIEEGRLNWNDVAKEESTVKILGASPEAFEFPDLKIEGTKQASGN